jgi:hypothetical protein
MSGAVMAASAMILMFIVVDPVACFDPHAQHGRFRPPQRLPSAVDQQYTFADDFLCAIAHWTIARWASEVCPAEPNYIFATASSFANLSAEQAAHLRDSIAQEHDLFEIRTALEPLISNYPECPLRILFSAPLQASSLYSARELISTLYQPESVIR